MNIIIGSGKWATHLAHYFSLLEVPFSQWSRNKFTEHDLLQLLDKTKHRSSYIYLAISDDQIYSFYQKYIKSLTENSSPSCICTKSSSAPWLEVTQTSIENDHKMTVVHFSGALHFDEIPCAHPLMSFGKDLYDLNTYQKIHFTISGAAHLNSLIPNINNRFSSITPSQKPLYHALCVLGGNMTQILYKKMIFDLYQLSVPVEASSTYLEQILKNTHLLNDTFFETHLIEAIPSEIVPSEVQKYLPDSGPLIRRDSKTIQLHLETLSKDPFYKVYSVFLDLFKINPNVKLKDNSKDIRNENSL